MAKYLYSISKKMKNEYSTQMPKKLMYRYIGFITLAIIVLTTYVYSQNSANNQSLVAASLPTYSGYELVWQDEFDSKEIDNTKWTLEQGDGCPTLCGWGNNELQQYTNSNENVFIHNGKLTIRALSVEDVNNKYTSARLKTKGKGDWKYGKIDIKAKVPKGKGIWPAIWMMPTDSQFGSWPQSGEIDIMELVGHKPDSIHGTVHFGQKWPNNKRKGNIHLIEKGDYSSEYHIYSIDWSENSIKWLIDGVQYGETLTTESLGEEKYPFNEKFYMILNLAVGGDWPGSPDQFTSFPTDFIIDYVRIYQPI